MKKILTIVCALTLIVATVTTISLTAAASTSQSITATYDNRNVTPNPGEDTQDATWGVLLPTAVVFSTTQTSQDVSVELAGYNGVATADLPNTVAATVSVKSANGYKLIYNGTSVSYKLAYGATELSSGTDATTIATLKTDDLANNSNKQVGTGTITGSSTLKGIYTDTLTYTVDAVS